MSWNASQSGNTWGKETLEITYKTIGRPIINYEAPIYAPGLSDTNWSSLQTAQNSALRTITGCHFITHIEHLDEETEILPVRAHTEILANKHAYKCHRTQNLKFHLTQVRRCIREPLITKYKEYHKRPLTTGYQNHIQTRNSCYIRGNSNLGIYKTMMI